MINFKVGMPSGDHFAYNYILDAEGTPNNVLLYEKTTYNSTSVHAHLYRFQDPAPFSEFFEKQDQKELQDYFLKYHRKKYLYYTMVDRWKKPLERKQRRKERIKIIAQERANLIVEPQQAKFVIHNPALGIEYPPRTNKQFAVVQVDGFQYKVMEDSILMLDTKEGHAINEPIVFEKIPLIGTNSYTVLGRPHIGGARVEAIIESISATEKIIVFKKKRRKGYKRSFGSRTSLTQCRITRIVYQLTQDILDKAIALS